MRQKCMMLDKKHSQNPGHTMWNVGSNDQKKSVGCCFLELLNSTKQGLCSKL